MNTKIVTFLASLLFILSCGQSPNAEHPTPPSLVGVWTTQCKQNAIDKSGLSNGSGDYSIEKIIVDGTSRLYYEKAVYGKADPNCNLFNPTMVSEYYTYSTNDTVKTIKDTYGIDLIPEIGKSTSAVAQSGIYRVNKNGATDPVTNTTKDILDIAISTNKESTFTTSNTTTYTKDTTLQAVIP